MNLNAHFVIRYLLSFSEKQKEKNAKSELYKFNIQVFFLVDSEHA